MLIRQVGVGVCGVDGEEWRTFSAANVFIGGGTLQLKTRFGTRAPAPWLRALLWALITAMLPFLFAVFHLSGKLHLQAPSCSLRFADRRGTMRKQTDQKEADKERHSSERMSSLLHKSPKIGCYFVVF